MSLKLQPGTVHQIVTLMTQLQATVHLPPKKERKKERKKGTVWIRAIYLPCGCVSPEIGKLSCKPVVDLIESQLSVWGLQNGLRTGRDTIR